MVLLDAPGASARRLTFDGLRCTGVDYDWRGNTVSANAAREVIVCGGAINSVFGGVISFDSDDVISSGSDDVISPGSGSAINFSSGGIIVSAYLFGYGPGQLIWGQLADRFGRIPASFMSQHGYLVADLLAAREAAGSQK